MNILVASDSFKGCMSSREANERIRNGLLQADPDLHVDCFPISDGGEGMVDAFCSAVNGQIRKVKVPDLYGNRMVARYGYDAHEQCACIEAASVLGVTLYPHGHRHPMDASSWGLGILLKEVLKEPVKQIIIGLGGTGTNDGGMGLLAAFGAVFYDAHRKVLTPCARNLDKIAFIDKRGFYFDRHVRLIAACDVSNPLLGIRGATHVFGKQKGLKPSQIALVEKGMRKLSGKIEQTFHVDMAGEPGSGAAGGLGGMLIAVFRAVMISGIDVLRDLGELDEKISRADLVFTGEGQTDLQTGYGKAVFKIATLCKEFDTPLVCLSGALGVGYEQLYDVGVTAMFSTANRALSFPQALRCGPENLEQAAYNLMKLTLAVRKEYVE